MNPGQALLIFVGIPVAFAALVALLVFAGSWTRSGRAEDVAGAVSADGPLFLATESSLPDPARLPNEIGASSSTFAGGGAHGTW